MHRTALLAFSALVLPGTAPAADMITDGAYRQTTYHSSAVHTSPRYVAYAYEVCDDLLLTYRSPHEPRHDTVRLCHPPVPGQ